MDESRDEEDNMPEGEAVLQKMALEILLKYGHADASINTHGHQFLDAASLNVSLPQASLSGKVEIVVLLK